MKLPFRRLTLTVSAFATLILLAIGWTVVFGQSIKAAVLAGGKHILGATAAPPDSRHGDPTLKNFASVHLPLDACCAAGSRLYDTAAPGGYATATNYPRRVRFGSPGKGLFLLAQPDVGVQIPRCLGMRVVLVNQTSDLLAFPAFDSHLYLVQEALAPDGTWKRIEQIPSGFCGNSFHRAFLPRSHYWEFGAPRYQGTLKTKLRFALRLAGGEKVTSNTFEGAVNPEQFEAR